ncbi:MAG TPA: phosphatidylserine decarboxylase, partial [Mobilitalea sp.]|nr:phosphatidylserine decarboxylase [Mobilitalea sp.]
MECMDRKGNKYKQDDAQNKILKFLYKNKVGRIILKQLINPWVTNLSEIVMNSPFSRMFIPLFIKKYKIDMNEFEDRTYYSYNDFFTRKIKKGRRLIDRNPNHLIAPCDGKSSVYPVSRDSQ